MYLIMVIKDTVADVKEIQIDMILIQMEQEKFVDSCDKCNNKYTFIKTSENHYLCMVCGVVKKIK